MTENFNYSKQLTWLIRLRWSALVGQMILLVIAHKVFHLSLPVLSIWCIIIFIAVTNLRLQFYSIYSKRFQKRLIGGTLILDIGILTALLYLSGGPTNPFSIVYLVHVAIAALLLGSTWTWITVAMSSICFAWLFKFHLVVPELVMHHDAPGEVFSAHLYGMLLAFALVAILIGFFLTKMSEALRAQEKEIGDLRLMAAHQERLTSLMTLAAGAAHELNTPLGTIALAAKELKLALIKHKTASELIEDTDLILSQIERCGTIIEKMGGHAGEMMGEMPEVIGSIELFRNLSQHLGDPYIQNLIIDSEKEFSITAPRKALIEALSTLIKNGFDACIKSRPIRLVINASNDWTMFSIIDEGTGIPNEIFSRIGEPFFTTKEPGKGMGLGVFLVKLFAARLGGSFELSSVLGKGTTAMLRIPQTL